MKKKESKNISLKSKKFKPGNLIETIQLKDNILQNITYHNARFNKTRKELFGINESVNLAKEISIPKIYSSGIFKCRVTYSEKIEKIEFEPYKRPKIQSLKCISADRLNYPYKFSDRTEIISHYAQRGEFDDILFIKDGMVTDTSYANIIFWDGDQWFTPSTPLLKGTTRARLLREGKITEASIDVNQIKKYTKARIINAMNDMDESADISIKDIV